MTSWHVKKGNMGDLTCEVVVVEKDILQVVTISHT